MASPELRTRVSAELWARLEKRAEATGRTMRQAVEEYLARGMDAEEMFDPAVENRIAATCREMARRVATRKVAVRPRETKR